MVKPKSTSQKDLDAIGHSHHGSERCTAGMRSTEFLGLLPPCFGSDENKGGIPGVITTILSNLLE